MEIVGFINFVEIGGFIHFVEIGGICNMHHWLRGMDAPKGVEVLVKSSLTEETDFDVKHLALLYLRRNPFHCSCVLRPWLLQLRPFVSHCSTASPYSRCTRWHCAGSRPWADADSGSQGRSSA